MKRIYCPRCDDMVLAEVTREVRLLRVKGIDVSAPQLVARCPTCGDSIADEQMTCANLSEGLNAYRVSQGLLSPAEIRRAYERYGLTQQSFAKLLGLGAATLSRYEHGAVQTKQIDLAIRDAGTPAGMARLLKERGSSISADQREAAVAAVSASAEHARPSVSPDGGAADFAVVPIGSAPSEFNGFTRLDVAKAMQMLGFMAGHCTGAGRTRLNKAMFYADYLWFASEANSMSGLKYARAPYGPVVDQFDVLFGEAVRWGYLTEQVVSFGRYDAMAYAPATTFDASLFSEGEVALMERVAEFINSFDSAADLSEYSHREQAWCSRADGESLSYLDAVGMRLPDTGPVEGSCPEFLE